ncbi:Dam family site-specific DNA-(adenine-N6)-methyltransferase, partial [Hafnia alvei]|uniref:Dam family site-specific DNA-(adenine-N6)-methyltransferase n=1 Tax=Hafnia alvei TaxID=569 RepID=UPI0018DC7D94
MIRPFIKWAGGKSRVMPKLLPHLPKADCLIEPFVGGASVFLNTDYRRYILADINRDLINLYEYAKNDTDNLIAIAKGMFAIGNTAEYYATARNEFTIRPQLGLMNAATFLYLNRHGFNGVCRYNSKGGFTVPYGKHKTPPYFPEKEIREFAQKANDTHAKFICAPFHNTISVMATEGAVIYCDPPYIPISATANFTQYAKEPFGRVEHMHLVTSLLAANLAHAVPVVISNSD